MHDSCCARFSSAVGLLQVTACSSGVCRIQFQDKGQEDLSAVKDCQHLETAVSWLTNYSSGAFDALPAHVTMCYHNCTDFQKRVYEALRQVPAGQTVSYQELSVRAVGNDRSARAVGSAMRKNACPILVPCHRVIKSNGELGLYSAGAGTHLKRELICHETRSFRRS